MPKLVNTVKSTVWDGAKDAAKFGAIGGGSVVLGRAIAGAFGGAIAAHLASGGLVKNDMDKKIIRANAWMDATVAMLS